MQEKIIPLLIERDILEVNLMENLKDVDFVFHEAA